MFKKIRVEDAVGLALGHDLTKVVPGVCKKAAFKRGHIIQVEDIPEMLSMGKQHVYVVEEDEGDVHEEEAAFRLSRAFAGENTDFSGVHEGRIDIRATISGLLRVDAELVGLINSIPDVVISTRHNNTVCEPGMTLAGTKIVPLYTTDTRLRQVEQLCAGRGKAVRVLPFILKKVGVVVTGSEVFNGLIKDKFTETMKAKIEELGACLHHSAIVPDEEDKIAAAVLEMKERGCDAIIACGGFSVDPDDVTVEGVKKSGAEIFSYGVPIMPGTMCMAAYLDGIPILGAPACAIWNKATVIDMLLPRALAGQVITRQEIVAMGHGGLCLGCQPCHYPVCPFGR
jgi:molybdenum cofactor synthesis domain-containing protein